MSTELTCGSSALASSGIEWRKRTFSTDQGGNCVEVAGFAGQIMVRDSKNPNGPSLTFTVAEWAAFIAGAQDGQFDLT